MDWDLNIGAQVHCADGRCGKLVALVTDPDTNQVTGLVIEKGLLLKKDRVIPLAKVVTTTDDGVHLDLSEEELTKFPEYDETQLRIKGPDYDESEKYRRQAHVQDTGYYGQQVPLPVVPQLRQRIEVEAGVKVESVAVGRGTEVRTLGGDVGRVDHVLMNPENHEVTHIVVDPGLFGESLVVPMEFVREIGDEGIILALNKDELEDIPPYEPRGDEEVETEIREQLLRQLPQYGGVEVTVTDGVAHMTGSAPDMKARRHLEAVVRSIEGVIEVENDVQVGSTIQERVRAALGADQRTEGAHIEVVNRAGVVTLKGRVENKEIRRAAGKVTAEQDRVIKVINELEVQPGEES